MNFNPKALLKTCHYKRVLKQKCYCVDLKNMWPNSLCGRGRKCLLTEADDSRPLSLHPYQHYHGAYQLGKVSCWWHHQHRRCWAERTQQVFVWLKLLFAIFPPHWTRGMKPAPMSTPGRTPELLAGSVLWLKTPSLCWKLFSSFFLLLKVGVFVCAW